jgi:non-canonical purine NTP pyrophosphatase (RdgB/HAM1 family)
VTLFFITGNKGKFAEVERMLPGVQRLDLDLPEVQSLDPHEVIREKLLAAKQCHEGEFIVEDTSVVVHGMGQLPGPFIKWFLQSLSLERFASLAQSSGDPSATARVCIGYLGQGDPQFFEGMVTGKITAPRGQNGFGWDKVFMPAGSDRTFGEYSAEEKDAVSMRRQAVEKLRFFLEEKKQNL